MEPAKKPNKAAPSAKTQPKLTIMRSKDGRTLSNFKDCKIVMRISLENLPLPLMIPIRPPPTNLAIVPPEELLMPDDLNFSLLFPSASLEHFTAPLHIDERQLLMGFESVPEWSPDELENLLLPDDSAGNEAEEEVDMNATQPAPQSMKFNFPPPRMMAAGDVNGIETPPSSRKVISQPTEKQTSSLTLFSKRKQSLNVTRDESAEFIDVDEEEIVRRRRRQLELLVEEQSISDGQCDLETKTMARPTGLDAGEASMAPYSPTIELEENVRMARTSSISCVRTLRSNSTLVSEGFNSSSTVRSKTKRGSRRFTCHCKRTFRSEKSFEEHLKTHDE